MIEFIGELKVELFRNEETGVGVQKYHVSSVIRDEEGHAQSQVTLKGCGLPSCRTVSYRICGNWICHPKYGWQVEVTHCEEHVQLTKDGIIKYLVKGPIKGIGPVMAERIYAAFGVDTIDVLNHDPERLGEIKGMGTRKLIRIVQSRNEASAFREVSEYLIPYGIEPATCLKVANRFGAASLDVIRSDPWRLTEDGMCSFPEVDAIVRTKHLPLNTRERISAALRYALMQNEYTGSPGCPAKELGDRAMRLLGTAVPQEKVELVCRTMKAEKQIYCTRLTGETLFYREEAFLAECHFAKKCADLLKRKLPVQKEKVESLIRKCEDEMGIAYSEEQKEAIRASASASLMVLTGGPGCGKTTVLNGICYVNEHLTGADFCLLAPTGKASAKMAEATGRIAYTIDSMLHLRSLGSSYQRDVPEIEEDITVVDESSMLDIYHAASLVTAVKKRLIFIGDVDQLPSVGPGTVLKSLIESGICPTVTLSRIYRQSGGSAVIENAYRINEGKCDLVTAENFHFVRVTSDQKIAEYLKKSYRHYAEKYGLEHVMCLLPTKKTQEVGTIPMNKVLQEAENPAVGQAEIEFRGRVFREGDYLLNTKNDVEKNVVNGDVGKLTKIRKTAEGLRELTVRFPGNEVTFTGEDEISRLIHAYAITVHKSQGSEADAVVIGLSPGMGNSMMKRNLLYTAVTRAKKEVLIIGKQEVLTRCICTMDTEKRKTALKELLLEAQKKRG